MKFSKRGDGAGADSNIPQEVPKSRRQTQESVIIYIAILFTVAFLLILLSYFMQQRHSEDTISSLTQSHNQFSSQALANIEELQNQNIALKTETEELRDEISDRDLKIEELEEAMEQLREDWAADVKSVTDQMKTDINIEAQRSMALEAMYKARTALDSGDIQTAKSQLLQAEHFKAQLSESWQAEYDKINQEIKTAEEQQND